MEYQIRKCEARDLKTLHNLEQQIFPEDAWSYKLFEAEFNQKNTKYYVAETDKIVGYAGIANGPDYSDIMTLAVLPKYRKQGIAKELLTRLLAQTETRILLEVCEDNQAAIKLYQQFGFNIIDVRKRYYPDQKNAMVMMRG
ncbi:MAG: ribosomal protein S18-alanine N-acetyltransferase [Micrococcaceae bacterium]